MASMTASVSALANQLTDAQDKLNDELQASIDNMKDLDTNNVNKLNDELYDIGNLKALEAFTNRIVLEYVRLTEAQENLTDHYLNSFATIQKQDLAASESLKIDKEFSEMAQPASGEVGVCKAVDLKKATIQSQTINVEMAQAFNNYNYDEKNNIGKSYQNKMIKEALELGEVFFIDEGMFSGALTLSDDNIDKKHWMLAYLTNQMPLANALQSERGKMSINKYVVERRIWNSKVLMTQQVLINQITDRKGLLDPDWIEAYSGDKTTNKISLMDTLGREIDGKITTPGWFKNIKQMPQTGLKREMNYMLSLQNKVLLDIIKRRNDKNRLLSIGLMDDLNKRKAEFN
ncbi:MAG: hypothetical protein KZQ74_13700 [gamma proteobacterium symbiont of Bathyaustriella thionipta]|nr:hypothetical protein [gamma proteobacterium symbiont of Bathyaustriella thionipta]MCU7957927.1 hypothetical protein [gamma proteobacterium symbiont of Bathyaustriella thionipta]MCU7968225.1 hypothetical protein [gamma proteobacterium symbiont of Bathyaustriella thionipta]